MAEFFVKGVQNGYTALTFYATDITTAVVTQAMCDKGIANVFPNSYDNITHIVCAKDVRNIGDGAFSGCVSLSSVVLGSNTINVSSSAFSDSPSIKSVVIGKKITQTLVQMFPKSLTSIESIEWEEGATKTTSCNGATALTTITIPSSITTISDSTFQGCSSLTSVSLKDTNITTFERNAFKSCTSLSSISLPPTVMSFARNVFGEDSPLEEVEITDIAKWCSVEAPSQDYIFHRPYRLIVEGTTITHLEIPSTVSSVSSMAFAFCSSITSITFPSTLESLGVGAFQNCTNLVSVEMERTSSPTVTIGDGAFWECSSLVNVSDLLVNAKTVEQWAFFDCAGITSVSFSEGCETIAYQAFDGCTSISSVSLPDFIIDIFQNSFPTCPGWVADTTTMGGVTLYNGYVYKVDDSISECDLSSVKGILSDWTVSDNIASIILPEGLRKIPNSSFSSRALLSSIVIPSTVKEIGRNCFQRCPALTSVVLPQELEVIGLQGFAECDNLSTVVFNNSLLSLESYAFYACSSLTSISLPSSLTMIGDYAFAGCMQLASIDFSTSLTSLGAYSFFECTSLLSVTLPPSIKKIGNYAFSYCVKVSSVTIKPRYEPIKRELYISTGAFDSNYSLTTVSLGNFVSYIGNYVFESCYKLKYDTPPYPSLLCLDKWILGTNSTTETQPVELSRNDIEGIAEGALSGWNCSHIIFEGDIILNDSICTKNPNIKKLEFKGVTEIPSDAFYYCRYLEEVVFHEGLTHIRAGAFSYCKLSSISFPKTVQYIGESAFSDNRSLKSPLVFPDSLTHLGNNSFYGCYAIPSVKFGKGLKTVPAFIVYDTSDDLQLSKVEFGGNEEVLERNAFYRTVNLSSISLPESLKELQGGAFIYSGLKEISIPFGVEYVGDRCFAYSSSLTKVYFNGLYPQAPSDIFSGIPQHQVSLFVIPGDLGWNVAIPGTWGNQLIKYLDN